MPGRRIAPHGDTRADGVSDSYESRLTDAQYAALRRLPRRLRGNAATRLELGRARDDGHTISLLDNTASIAAGANIVTFTAYAAMPSVPALIAGLSADGSAVRAAISRPISESHRKRFSLHARDDNYVAFSSGERFRRFIMMP